MTFGSSFRKWGELLQVGGDHELGSLSCEERVNDVLPEVVAVSFPNSEILRKKHQIPRLRLILSSIRLRSSSRALILRRRLSLTTSSLRTIRTRYMNHMEAMNSIMTSELSNDIMLFMKHRPIIIPLYK